MADYHHSHIKVIIEELLPRAKSFVAEGQRRLAAQEARVADLKRKGRNTPESEKLLRVMRQTMEISHLQLLEREVRADEGRTAW